MRQKRFWDNLLKCASHLAIPSNGNHTQRGRSLILFPKLKRRKVFRSISRSLELCQTKQLTRDQASTEQTENPPQPPIHGSSHLIRTLTVQTTWDLSGIQSPFGFRCHRSESFCILLAVFGQRVLNRHILRFCVDNGSPQCHWLWNLGTKKTFLCFARHWQHKAARFAVWLAIRRRLAILVWGS